VPGKRVTLQPFVYGRPVLPDEFLNREAELRTIFNRLRNGESTAIVGEPHIGKSSLLLKLADQVTQQLYLGDDARHLVVSLLGLHSIGIDYTPASFWEEALEPLEGRPGHQAIAQRLRQATEARYTRRPLEQLFSSLGQQDQVLVLLLEEFGRLLGHPNFQDPAFFSLLRSLATRTGRLALVITSRLSLAEMSERGRDLLETGSPFFNHMIGLWLRPFDERTVEVLLDQASTSLSLDDRRFVRRVAGRHPFLLQTMAAALTETVGYERHARAAESFYERVSGHFDDLWRALDDRNRTTAVILSLVELGERALGQDFTYGEIERVDAFGLELRRLAEWGLAEQVSEGWQFDCAHLPLWRGERWTVTSQAFVWWVCDVAITKTRRVPAYDGWLADRHYRLLLTQEQWDRLLSAACGASRWAARGVGALGRALSEELVRRE